MSRPILLIITGLLFLASVAGQEPSICTGNALNRRAEYLPVPLFPQTARVLRKQTITVRVKNVGPEGWVHDAKACSGDAKLAMAAETAALRSKIKPTKLSSKFVATNGLLHFNFDPNTSFDKAFELPCFVAIDRHKYVNDLLVKLEKFNIPGTETIPHGAVILQVTINEDGSVGSAKSISGPTNMRVYAERALMASKFRALERCGKPAKLTALFGVNLSTIADN